MLGKLGRAIRNLREGAWLTPERATRYGQLLAVTVAIVAVAGAARTLLPLFTDAQGRAEPYDFAAFWSGARLAVQGHPAAAYDPATIARTELGAVRLPGIQSFPYLYPPVFLLLSLPLGLLPYLAALGLFLAGGYALATGCIRRILPAPFPILPILTFPAAIMNAVIEQNGFLSAACFGAAMLLLERRPILGGACLGCLAFKPHLAIGVPVALLAARRWRALLACGAVAGGLVLLSVALLGVDTWREFLLTLPRLRQVLQSPEIWPKLISPYGAILALHGGLKLAYAAQTASALGALAAVALVGLRRPGAGPEVATMVAAAMLCTPYLLDYDLVCLAVPMAWLARSGLALGWRPWEKTLLGALYIVPLQARILMVAGLPVATCLLVGLLCITVARSRGADAGLG